jgi:hypothetical protein
MKISLFIPFALQQAIYGLHFPFTCWITLNIFVATNVLFIILHVTTDQTFVLSSVSLMIEAENGVRCAPPVLKVIEALRHE